MNISENPSRNMRIALIILLIAVAFAAYANTLSNGFVYDDEYQVLKNPWIQDFRFLPAVFTSEVWGFRGESLSNYYRPLLHVVYMTAYRLFGYEAWGYHAVNLLLHGAVTVLVYLLLLIILTRQHARYAVAASLSAALIFAVHPIHTEVVAPVMSVTDLLVSLFCVSALYFHIRFLDRPWQYTLAPATLFGLALLSKEIAVTLPVILLVYDVVFEKNTLSPRRLAVRYAPYLFVAIVYLMIRNSVLGMFVPLDRHPDLSTAQAILNIMPLAVQYGFKLLIPINLNAMYEFHPVRSIAETGALVSTGIIAAGVVLLFIAARKSRITAFGLALILIPLLPAFYIRAIPYPFAERYLYLPSVGFSLMIAGLVSQYAQQPKAAKAMTAILLLIFCMYAAGTIQRNKIWKDNYTLWSDTVQKSPNNAIVRSNLGDALKNRGRIREAIEQITLATKLDPHTEFFRNLGNAYYDAGDRQEALRQYEKALSLEPANAMAHNDLGSLYGEMGEFNKAILHFESAVRLAPSHADSHYNLGMAYRDAGMIDKSVEQFEIAARINPQEPLYGKTLTETYQTKERSR